MSHPAKLREHCVGFKPRPSRNGRWWRIVCPKCGKKVDYQKSETEARTNWNAQMECFWNMKGFEDE